MKWVVLAARVFVGLAFVWGGLGFYAMIVLQQFGIQLFDTPQFPEGSPIAMFMGAMFPSGYLHAVKVFELVGGVLLLVGRYPLVGLTLVTPVAVNIMFFELFIAREPGPGIFLVLLCVFLVWAYRSLFAPVFEMKPKIG